MKGVLWCWVMCVNGLICGVWVDCENLCLLYCVEYFERGDEALRVVKYLVFGDKIFIVM